MGKDFRGRRTLPICLKMSQTIHWGEHRDRVTEILSEKFITTSKRFHRHVQYRPASFAFVSFEITICYNFVNLCVKISRTVFL